MSKLVVVQFSKAKVQIIVYFICSLPADLLWHFEKQMTSDSVI